MFCNREPKCVNADAVVDYITYIKDFLKNKKTLIKQPYYVFCDESGPNKSPKVI